jgi:predicted nucleic acid-binding Zn ribbon protein
MPTYLYKNLETGEIYELQQSMRDDAYTAHPDSGVPVKRIVARPGIAFKGSGFYVTDSRPQARGEAKKEGGSSAPASAGSSSAGSAKGTGGE